MIGGAVSILSWWILALWVHPPNEKPKRQWQCTRHWCHDDKDPWFDKGGLLEDEINPQVAKKLAMADNVGPLGARLCDEMLFGKGVYSVYSRGRKPGEAAQEPDHSIPSQQYNVN
jgi:hypothetical protein